MTESCGFSTVSAFCHFELPFLQSMLNKGDRFDLLIQVRINLTHPFWCVIIA